MPKYRVNRSGWFGDGTYRKAGAIVMLTSEQAKYYLPPHDDRLEEVKPLIARHPVTAPAKAEAETDQG